MEIPAELRRMPPASTTVYRRELVVRRWVRTDRPPDAGVVENEAATLRLMTSVPEVLTPDLVAFDPVAEHADAPALAMTRLRGHDDLAPADVDAYLDGLVATLRAIHAVAVPAAAPLFDYEPWGLERVVDVPAWSRRPDVWRRAIEISRRPVPDAVPVLCHRDLHPGNVLWHHGHVSGVVDVVGAESPEVWRWHDAGRTDVTIDRIVRTWDDFLAAAVERCS